MQHPIIQRYISELKTASFPYFTTETQVLCGRVALTAMPGIDCELVHSFRLDLPPDAQPNELAYPLLFLVSVFSKETFCEFRPKMRDSILATKEYSVVLDGWRLHIFTEDGHRVYLVELKDQAP